MKLFLMRIVMRVFSWITPRAAEYIAPPVAAVLWFLSPRKRRVTRLNLRAVYPHLDVGQRHKIARDSMTHYVRGLFEAGMLWHWPLEKVFACIDGQEIMEVYHQAEREGKGVIMAGVHCGSWELLGLLMQQYMNGAMLYKPGRHPDVEELLLEKRRRGGATLVPATSAGLRTILRLIRAGNTVVMVQDQEPTLGEGQFAPFYNIETLTGILLPRMAQRTGARVIFGTLERRKGGRYRVHVFNADEAIYSDDMREATTAVNKDIERCIEVDSAQNLWAYKRFRNRPDGGKSFYKRQNRSNPTGS